ncbi:hypothetical protein FRAHR75_380045 [Frankia sp. Hr75.2]|nr:hypothetical protein FRAHR75_380045 [Frankia sp. Hr75.2]SQD93910.1 hypothetical protein FMEAI12_2080002 [Parafrankia sp. Ea1.12]
MVSNRIGDLARQGLVRQGLVRQGLVRCVAVGAYGCRTVVVAGAGLRGIAASVSPHGEVPVRQVGTGGGRGAHHRCRPFGRSTHMRWGHAGDGPRV